VAGGHLCGSPAKEIFASFAALDFSGTAWPNLVLFGGSSFRPSRTSRENNQQPKEKRINVMAKYMCTHTIPPGKYTADQLRQFAQAAQQDPTVKGYRSFANLAEGKAICIMEASGEAAIATWFTKMGMPYDSITKVELEGNRGSIQAA
jgi:uncharacterized protein DUF4242